MFILFYFFIYLLVYFSVFNLIEVFRKFYLVDFTTYDKQAYFSVTLQNGKD